MKTEDTFDPMTSCVYEIVNGDDIELCGLPENHTCHRGGIKSSWPAQPEPHRFVRGDAPERTEATFDAVKLLRDMERYERDNEWGATFGEIADALEAKDREIERLRGILETERQWLVRRNEYVEKAKAALESAT